MVMLAYIIHRRKYTTLIFIWKRPVEYLISLFKRGHVGDDRDSRRLALIENDIISRKADSRRFPITTRYPPGSVREAPRH